MLVPTGSFCAQGTGSCFRKTDLPFGDGTKHLRSSAAQMFARCVILSTNKPGRKKKIQLWKGFCTPSWDFVSSLIGTYMSLISGVELATSPNAN